MIDSKFIEEQSRKMQTSKDNIAREYCQHLFLSKFYSQADAEKVLFKGGTALRILWQSPRFSEDLDFSGVSVTQFTLENRIQTTLLEMEREGFNADILESKKTTGGYLGKFLLQWLDLSVSIKIEISLRERRGAGASEQTMVPNDFIPSYILVHLPQEELIREKITALLQRAKPRDYFDLYFILRSRLAFPSVFGGDKTLKPRILNQLRGSEINFSSELRQFLPASHHALLKNFRDILARELTRAFS